MPLQLYTLTRAGVALFAAGLCGLAAAQSGASAIYSCIDGKGRRITADRPIAECMDRTQKQLSGSGLVKREIAPVLTKDERLAQEKKEKLALEQQAREAEEKKRDRALVTRYPNRAAHDKVRAEALVPMQEAIQTSVKRSEELAAQRKVISADLEFYKATPGRAPASLKRRLEENDSSVAAQKRFIAEQEAEKKRVNMRFDEELAKLKPFWAEAAAPPAGTAKR